MSWGKIDKDWHDQKNLRRSPSAPKHGSLGIFLTLLRFARRFKDSMVLIEQTLEMAAGSYSISGIFMYLQGKNFHLWGSSIV